MHYLEILQRLCLRQWSFNKYLWRYSLLSITTMTYDAYHSQMILKMIINWKSNDHYERFGCIDLEEAIRGSKATQASDNVMRDHFARTLR